MVVAILKRHGLTTIMASKQGQVAERLANWANLGEREDPVAFAGRTQEIALAIRQLTTWRRGSASGRTVVAQGAPGAGKTALLHEIARELPERLPGAKSIYRPTPWNRHSAANVLLSLADRMMGEAAASFRTTEATETSVGARAVAAAHVDRSRTTAPPALASWDDFHTLFSPKAEQAKPTLLLVDEIQRMGDDEESTDLLYHLHDQTTFPVVLVCGGLSTSAMRLTGVGLSRLNEANILHIDALTIEEAEQSLEESLRITAEDLGGIAGHPDQWARQLAPATQGWPQHVTCHLRAAAEAMLESGRVAFDDDNLRRALARAQDNMQRYYNRRLDASCTNESIVFAIHEAIRVGHIHRTDAMALVDVVRARLGPYAREDHDRHFERPGDCVDRLLYAGIIAYANGSISSPLSIPIPSMAAHIADRVPGKEREEIRRTIENQWEGDG